MLTEYSVIDRIEVLETGAIQVRRADRILRDGVMASQDFHRHVLAPGDDLSGEDARVAAVAATVWTPEVVAAWVAAHPAPQADQTPA